MRTSPLFLLPLAVSALPPAKKDLTSVAKSVFCVLHNDVITALKAQTTATSYCSSYLSISTKTFSTTSTVTPTSVHVTTTATVTGDPYTTTSIATETTTTDLHVPETVTETDTTTVTLTTSTVTLSCLNTAYTATAAGGNQKRGAVQKPTCLPSSWAASAISSACSCLSIPTPSTTTTHTVTLVPGTVTDTTTQTLIPTLTSTVTTTEISTNTVTDYTTTTTTTTATVYATATTVSASGLTFRKYTHDYDADSDDSGFTPSYFKTASVDFSGSLQNVDFSTPNWPSGSTYLTLDGHYFDSSQAAVLMQGFFVAQATGTYTISTSASYIDNYGYLWTGDAAYTWSDGTTAYEATRTGAGYYGGSTSITMNAGDALPMTWLWANGGGVGQSHFVITPPSGASTTDTTGYFAPACSSSVFV